MYYFIINPRSSSGKGLKYWWTVKEELDRQEVMYSAIFTRHAGHATEIAGQICSNNPGIKNIVILGGDGTVNEAINGIDNYKEVLLGYIPAGSSNDLARCLQIPKDPIKALANILKPTRFKYLDNGRVTFPDLDIPPRKFACSSGIGYDASVCNEVQESPLKRRLNRYGAGKLVYFAIAIKQMLTVQPANGTVIVNGQKKNTYKKILLVSSMIHKCEGGGLRMAPNADPTDGQLSVCLVHGLSRLKIIWLMPMLLLGKHIYFKGVDSFHCTDIEINLDRNAAVHTDGEIPAICSHIRVTNLKEQIRMIL